MSTILEDSNRIVNENVGSLKIENCVITGEEVAKYRGKDIQCALDKAGVQRKLDPDGIYNVFRPLSEITNALESFNGLHLLDRHIPITSTRPVKSEWIGHIGTSGCIVGTDLLNTVVVTLDSAIKEIQIADKSDGKFGKKDLSAGYAFEVRAEDGVYKGEVYEFVMHSLEGNHVALVEDGRHPRAQIADSNNIFIEGKNRMSSLIRNLYNKVKSIAMDSDGEYEGREDAHIKAIIKEAKKMEEVQVQEKQAHDESTEKEDDEGKKDEKKFETAKDRKKSKAHDKDMEEDCPDEDDKEEMKDCKAKDRKSKAHDMESEADDESDDDMDDKKMAKDRKAKAHDSNSVQAAVKAQVESIMQAYSLTSKVLGNVSHNFLQDSNYSADTILTKGLTLKGLACDGKSVEAKMAMMEVLAKKGTGAPTRIAMDSSSKKRVNSVNDILNPKR